MNFPDGLYQLDTGWACGGVFVKAGRIHYGAPIFRKFHNLYLENLIKHYKATFIGP